DSRRADPLRTDNPPAEQDVLEDAHGRTLDDPARKPSIGGQAVAADCIPLLAKICGNGRGGTAWRHDGMATAAVPNTKEHGDGRIELIDTTRIEESPLYNKDLAPVPVARRNWTTYNYAALWISMAHCIPTYNLAAGLISVGMNWWQAIFTILLGNTIVLVPILLNSPPGTKYGIPFPVFARASYGTLGSNLPALMRAIVACGWFGIQSWIGGEAFQTLFSAIFPGWPGLFGNLWGRPATEWISFL